MRNVRKIISLTLILMLLLGASFSVFAAEEGGAQPSEKLTRAAAAALLWKGFGSAPVQGDPGSYSDVSEKSDAFAATRWAREQGILPKTEMLYADAFCTRSYFVNMLWKAYGSPVSCRSTGFADVSKDAFYAEALGWAEKAGIVSGSYFSPEAAITADQADYYMQKAASAPRSKTQESLVRDEKGLRFRYNGGYVSNDWVITGGKAYHFNSFGYMDKTQDQAPSMTTLDGFYVHPMLANKYNTAEERIEAMIAAAYEYLGDKFVVYYSTAPHSRGVDCSGLVMQALYAAGFDPYPATPAHHSYTEYDSRTLWNEVSMLKVDPKDMKRGDLVYYKRTPESDTINHIAICLGNGKVIEAWPPKVSDYYDVAGSPHEYIYGVARPFY